MDKNQEAFEEALEHETRELMLMSEADRFQYVKGVVESLADPISAIALEKAPAKKAKIAKELLQELNDKAPTLIPPIIYSIKQEYRQVYVQLLQKIDATFLPTFIHLLQEMAAHSSE